jgi:DHA1 family bicyclomycin/chloramphenicol resistance-like MFS transporter
MSFTSMVFITVPVLAPAIGGALLLVGSWRIIFASMLVCGVALGLWFIRRMPETLRPENRMPPTAARILDGIRLTVTNRVAFGYATAFGLLFACILGYVGSAQQILATDVYGLGDLFPVAFGLIACVMGVAAFINAKIVRRYGVRRVSHAGLLAYLLVAGLQVTLAIAFDGRPPLAVFGIVLAANQFLSSLCMPNFNAMAMEPLGSVAGTASAFIGAYTTVVATVLGLAIGQAFDGTVLPLATGYLLLSLGSVAIVLWTERGRLFAR